MSPLALAMVGDEVWATTPQGLQHSSDRGSTFEVLADAPLLWQVAAGPDGSLWGVDVDGLAWRSVDGDTWEPHLPVPPVEAIAVADESTAYGLAGAFLVRLTA